MGFKTDSFFGSFCILNDSFDSGDYFPLVSGSSTNLVVNLIYTRMFFSNTNRTNLTNCLGYDPVCIRGIREICGQLNIIHTLIFFFEH